MVAGFVAPQPAAFLSGSCWRQFRADSRGRDVEADMQIVTRHSGDGGRYDGGPVHRRPSAWFWITLVAAIIIGIASAVHFLGGGSKPLPRIELRIV